MLHLGLDPSKKVDDDHLTSCPHDKNVCGKVFCVQQSDHTPAACWFDAQMSYFPHEKSQFTLKLHSSEQSQTNLNHGQATIPQNVHNSAHRQSCA